MLIRAKQLLTHFANDSLYRNSIYLMMSTAIMATLGFIFWIICARIYSPQEIGIATTLISVTGLLTGFSVLGMSNGIIRYLPTSNQKNDKINTTLTLVIFASILFSAIYILGIDLFSPKLAFLKTNIWYSLAFTCFIILSTANVVLESVFIAYRSTRYILIKSTVLSVSKLALPFLLVFLGSMGIFLSFGIALALAVGLCILFLLLKFQYVYQFTVNKSALRKMLKFSFANYIAGFINSLSYSILPLIVIDRLGAVPAAYFSMAMMVANILYIIPNSTSQSLFAEGSHNATEVKKHLIKSIKINYLIIVPAILFVIFLGKYILLAFGKNYSSEGAELLAMLALAGIFITISYISNALMFIKHKMKYLIAVNALSVCIIVGLCEAFIRMGLEGVGLAWLVGQGLVAIMNGYLIKKFI